MGRFGLRLKPSGVAAALRIESQRRSSRTGFFVEDDGPGIPVEKREEVFGEGYSSNHDGTGLGLSIVETVADGHGWGLSVAESEEGGARFEVEGVDIVEKADRLNG